MDRHVDVIILSLLQFLDKTSSNVCVESIKNIIFFLIQSQLLLTWYNVTLFNPYLYTFTAIGDLILNQNIMTIGRRHLF